MLNVCVTVCVLIYYCSDFLLIVVVFETFILMCFSVCWHALSSQLHLRYQTLLVTSKPTS